MAMATDRQFLGYVLEQAGLGDALAAKPMFGEYSLYLDGLFLAVVADNQLFLKPTAEARALLPSPVEAPPYPGASPWLQVDEALDEPGLLRRLFRTTSAALPPPKPAGRAKSGKSGKSGKPAGASGRSPASR